MTFYHFTSKKNAKKIKKEGLTKGVTLLKSGLIGKTQWLTINPDVEQCGIKGVLKIINRQEARITVTIPKHLEPSLMSFDEFCNKHKENLPDYFDTQKDITKDWHVFIGEISPVWLKIRIY
jgi:hypothetical protein